MINMVLIMNQDIAVVAAALLAIVLGLYVLGGVSSFSGFLEGAAVSAIGGDPLGMGGVVGTSLGRDRFLVSGSVSSRGGNTYFGVSNLVGAFPDSHLFSIGVPVCTGIGRYLFRISKTVGTALGSMACLTTELESIFRSGIPVEFSEGFLFATLATNFERGSVIIG